MGKFSVTQVPLPNPYQVSDTPKPAMNFQFPQGSTKKFLMISNAGEVLEEHYLEMQRMPSNSNAIGQINYIDGEGSKDEIEFKHAPGADKFVAWHHNSPEHTFCMTPVMHNEYIVGMTVNFDDGADESDIITFVLEFATDSASDYSDWRDQVAVTELSTVGF